MHWITVSNVGCRQGTINYFVSLYRKVSSQSLKQIACIMFVNKEITINVIPVQMQQNGTDCGLFTIAFATSILHGDNPAIVKYDQMRMRSLFVKCIKAGRIENFPEYDASGKRYLKYPSPAPAACQSHQMRRVTTQLTVVTVLTFFIKNVYTHLWLSHNCQVPGFAPTANE